MAAASLRTSKPVYRCQERLRQLTSESSHYMKWGYFGDRLVDAVADVRSLRE